MNGLVWAILEDGIVTCKGTPESAWCSVTSAKPPLASRGRGDFLCRLDLDWTRSAVDWTKPRTLAAFGWRGAFLA